MGSMPHIGMCMCASPTPLDEPHHRISSQLAISFEAKHTPAAPRNAYAYACLGEIFKGTREEASVRRTEDGIRAERVGPAAERSTPYLAICISVGGIIRHYRPPQSFPHVLQYYGGPLRPPTAPLAAAARPHLILRPERARPWYAERMGSLSSPAQASALVPRPPC